MKKIIILSGFILLTMMVSAQFNLSGKVIDEKGNPVPGASVRIKGTRTGVAADDNGEFRILFIPPGMILEVSAVGCETVEIAVTSTAVSIVVVLRKSMLMGTEVIVTSLGMQLQKRSLGYSTSSVTVSAVNDNKQFGFKTWKRSGELEENSVRLSVGDKEYLPLKSVQVAVQIDGFRARVLFDYFFYSDKDKQLRGDFKLKLPAGASPYYFAFGGIEYINKEKETMAASFINYPLNKKINLSNDTVLSQRILSWPGLKEALVAPKEKAAHAYGEVVRGKADPALMEWAGADVFRCSVYPIQKNKLHRVVIGYDINLQESGNNALLKLVLPYAAIPKKLDIDIITAAGIIHKIIPALKSTLVNNNRTKYHLENFKEKSFELSMQTTGTVYLQQEGAEPYFAVTTEPSIPGNLAGPGAGQAIFLLDVSLSSQPDKFNVWLKLVESLLNNNRGTIKKFAVLCFNTDVFWWRKYYSPNNEISVGDFLDYADQLSLMGATDISLALQTASHPQWLKNESTEKTIFLLSDGDASWGEDNLYQLSGKVAPGDKVFAFTTGLSGTDTRVLDHLSRQTNGAVFSVLNEEEAEKVSRSVKFKPWHIKSISLKNCSDILITGRPYNIFPGQKLLISGRGIVDQNDELLLELEQGDTKKTITIPASQVISSNLTKRVYGQTAVTQLEDFSLKTEDAAIQYATYFNVAGQSCSWIMLEGAVLYSRYGINTESSKGYIDSHYVSAIVQQVLQNESAERSLGNAKEDLKAWLQKIQKEKIIDFTPDSVFTSFLNQLPGSAFIVNVPPVTGDLIFKKDWLRSTNDELSKSVLDYDNLIRSVYNEKKMEGKANAFKVLSSFAESNRSDLTLLREVAFQLSEWNLDGKAYELSKRLIAARPAEPPAYKQVANCLLKMNKTDLALLYYEICTLTYWDNRFAGFDLISAIEYYKLLNEISKGKYTVTNMDFVKKRIETVKAFLRSNTIEAGEADLMVVITWNTDNTDVDLHVREPNNQECSYQNKRTTNGGYLTNDATDGFGPETYILTKAIPGKYQLDIDYFSSSRVQTAAKSKILVTVYKNWGRSNEELTRKVVELKSAERKNNLRNNNDDDNDKLLKNVITLEF